MKFESFEEIVNFAIEKENEAAAFYDDAANKEPFSGVKDALKEMAAEERKHAAMLENIGQNQEVLEGYEFKWIPDIKRSDYMVDMVYEPGMHYSDLLKLAMKREEKALAMYNELQNRADNETQAKLFKVLCQEEAKHKLFLEKLYDDYMAELGD
jgi:rubrerythrin